MNPEQLKFDSRRLSNDELKFFIFHRMKSELAGFNIRVESENLLKPWGGYLKLNANDVNNFISAYFGTNFTFQTNMPLDPKILIIQPSASLSLQRHKRRSEIWKIVDGNGLIALGDSENSLTHTDVTVGNIIDIPVFKIHRFSASNCSWCKIAEIWRHSDSANLSDESDIERLQDDYSRIA